jgi:energy-coupling factor transporter ATP-binding protein EcfA2
MSDPAAVEFQHVFKTFGDRKVLDDVSFKVNEGEALCIMGRSGTGKSTSLRLMIGLLKPGQRQSLHWVGGYRSFQRGRSVRGCGVTWGSFSKAPLYSIRSRWKTIWLCRCAAWISRNLRQKLSALWTRHSNVWALIWT